MAAFIPEEKITEIKNTADIVEVISDAVLLKKQGRNYLGLCPFHTEKTPSFTVSPEKQIYYCFGCGNGGNVFSFIMQQEGLSFPETARMLARRFGIEIPEQRMTPEQKRRISEKERVLAINRYAMEFFSRNLHENSLGNRAMAYLKKRGMTKETIADFHLGYAPEGWEHLGNFFAKKQISHTLVEKSGLILPRKGGGYYDRFRDRIIFPIINMGKQVIGFGGRAMDDSLPKYLNSPETSVYQKSRSLYGLYEAKKTCREKDTIYIVEGYFDFLTLFQNGVRNVAATLGTALTSEHIRLIRGYASKIILVYDSDEGGIKAALRSVGMFMNAGVDARIMILPTGYDPDAYMFEFGTESFVNTASKALGLIPFLMNTAIKKHGLSVEGKIRVIAEMIEPLASIEDPVARSLYIKNLAETVDIDEAAILDKVRGITRKKSIKRSGLQRQRSGVDLRSNTTGQSNQIHRKANQNTGSRFERQILSMMLQFSEILPEVKKRNIIEHFDDEILKSIGRFILEHSEDSNRDISELINLIDDPEIRNLTASLNFGDEVWSLNGCLNMLDQYESSKHRRRNRLLQEIKAAEESNNRELLEKLLKDKQHQINKI